MTQLKSARADGVLTLTLDGRDSRNSIGPDLYRAVREAVINADDDPDIRAIVLTGANGYFSSGGNINALKQSAELPRGQVSANTDYLNSMIRAVHDSPLPVIGALEGGAAGAGASLALACDMLIAGEEAKLVVAYVRIGLTPDGGATHFLRSALPRQLAMEMCLLGRPMPVERLQHFGVVNQVVPTGSALDAAMDIAKTLAKGPSHALATIKSEVNSAPSNDLATHMAIEADGINKARYGAEAAEGLAAFLEKRKPDFSKS